MIKYEILSTTTIGNGIPYHHCGKIEKMICDECGGECEFDTRIKDNSTKSGFGFRVGKFITFIGKTACGPMITIDLCEKCSMNLIKYFEKRKKIKVNRDYF